MKILKMFFLFLLFWLQYSLWLGKNGIFDYIKIYKKVILEKINNEYLDMRNKEVIANIKNLNNDINHQK
ncbi:cell division protein FtsB [Buchnera aphidicola (Macrosiphoniella sanborni)]|uniref:Cell division protein FtsB n=2 Tax=Buchnera aphidicola TaxID=9 RepID=A0A4D6YEE3_9GAMM|nr:cell division protein FtsB [Buchnera aphidicola (Macrosiphoniella sanborni)]